MRGRVLLVDDNPLNAKLTGLVLRQAGYTVEAAGDANEALSALERTVPDVILMDLQLPGMSGFELTRHIRTMPALRDVVVVALTAYAMKGDEERALAAGCDGYIAKPIDTRALPDQIEAYRSTRRSADPPGSGE